MDKKGFTMPYVFVMTGKSKKRSTNRTRRKRFCGEHNESDFDSSDNNITPRPSRSGGPSRPARRQNRKTPRRKPRPQYNFPSDEDSDSEYQIPLDLPCSSTATVASNKRTTRRSKPALIPSGQVITLEESDNDDQCTTQIKNQVDHFFKSSNLLSDDEDLPLQKTDDELKPSTSTAKPKSFSYLSDSDDDILRGYKKEDIPINIDPGPSTSSAASTRGKSPCLYSSDLSKSSTDTIIYVPPGTGELNNFTNMVFSDLSNENAQPRTQNCDNVQIKSDDIESCLDENKKTLENDHDVDLVVRGNKQKNLKSKEEPKDDDILSLSFLDSICVDDEELKKDDEIRDMKSFEDFRIETEAMLKDVSSMITTFVAKPQEPEIVFIEVPKEPEPVPAPKPVFQEEISPKKSAGSCPICLEVMNNNVMATMCGHIFCKACITHVAKTSKKCPTCRKSVTMKKIHQIYI